MKPYAPTQEPLRIEVLDAPLPDRMVYGWNRYADWKSLASGGTCEIRTAFDRNLGRRVAIKTLHRDYEANETLQRRFVREARITAGLQHPNTPPVYEIGRDDHLRPYFSMKIVRGRSLLNLFDMLRAGDQAVTSAYPLFRQLEVFTQVALAAAYAHALGVIHRDLKPANVQIGSFGEVILLDWGLAKLVTDREILMETDNGEPRIALELTRAGSRLGTPLYMSPEQASGAASLDSRSDVFAMGIILYELLTKQPLFRGDTVHEVRRQIHEKVIPPPSAAGSGYLIPPELDAICLRALERDLSARYQSLIHLINDLDGYRGSGSISQAPPNRDAPPFDP